MLFARAPTLAALAAPRREPEQCPTHERWPRQVDRLRCDVRDGCQRASRGHSELHVARSAAALDPRRTRGAVFTRSDALLRADRAARVPRALQRRSVGGLEPATCSALLARTRDPGAPRYARAESLGPRSGTPAAHRVGSHAAAGRD